MEEDLTQEILFGKPDLSEEEELQLRAQAGQSVQELQAMESMANQQNAALQQPQGSTQQIQAQPTGQGQQEQQQADNTNIFQQAGDVIKGTFDVLSSPGRGINDFFVDSVNLLPGVKLRKAPKFESDVAQSVREISSVVLPTIFITKGLGGAASGAASASKAKLFADPFLKFIGEKSLAAGVGAGVDYIVETNQLDDNVTGSVRKYFPRFFGWIPDNIATLDSDSPDVKRMKNVVEGVGLGLFTDLIEGVAKLVSSARGVSKATRYTPESEKARAYLAKTAAKETSDDVEEIVAESAARRSDALDELGEYNFSKSQNLDEPVFGISDLYGYEESGIRSVDPLGAIGASVDVARIANNIDSVYGRVGSVISESALKFGLEIPDGQEAIIRGIAQQLKDAGEYGYTTASGKYLSFKEIQQAGEDLALDFYKMNTPELKRAIKQFQGVDVDTGVPVLKSEAYAAVFKTINKYMKDLVDMDVMRAQAYIGTSFAGQVSDMAQGIRLMDGTAAVERAQDQIFDRLQFLLAQKGMTSYSRGRALNMLNVWKRLDPANPIQKKLVNAASYMTDQGKKIKDFIAGEKDITAEAVDRIKREAKQTVETLREMRKENPEMLRALINAYELSDGDLDSMTKLNNYVKNSLGVASKAVIDLQPEIPSLVMQGFNASIYNSVLSAAATTINTAYSNAVLLVERPIAQMAGALIAKDMSVVRKGLYQYSAAWETLTQAMAYSKRVFRKSASDPYVMKLRDNLEVQSEVQLAINREFAEAAAKRGDYGPQAIMTMIEEQKDINDSPWARLGNRGMQTSDGFTQSIIANWEARGRAFDKVTNGGKLPLNRENADRIAKEVYNSFFDENDTITDSAVRYAAGEISMSLDNPANDALSALIRRAPILKGFFLFTKTPLNMAGYQLSQNPIGLFIDKLNAFEKPFAEMSGPQVMKLLTSRGIDYGMENIESVYNTERAILKGRKAYGMTSIMAAGGLYFAGRITGDGIYDYEKQRLRRDAGIPDRSIKGLDGKWYSYDKIPGVSDWLALTVNIMDNFDVLRPSELAENLRVAGFVLGATITDKSMLAAMEPLMDILRGDVGAINRWSSGYATAAVTPGSSLMAEFGRLITANKKELESNFFDLVANRNPVLKQSLPDAYDWIDGGKVGEPTDFWTRVWNTYLPWKVTGEISPEKQFLVDIEYDARPSLRTNGRGVEYTNEERSEVMSMMGKMGIFKAEIQRIMQTTEAKKFRKEYKDLVARGYSIESDEFSPLSLYLDAALRSSMRLAEAQISSRDRIAQKVYENQAIKEYLRAKDVEGADRFLKNMKQTMSY